MTNCRETVAVLLDYVEGRLPADQQAEVDRHFSDCPECLRFVREYRALPDKLRSATTVEMPPEVGLRLREFLRAHRKD